MEGQSSYSFESYVSTIKNIKSVSLNFMPNSIEKGPVVPMILDPRTKNLVLKNVLSKQITKRISKPVLDEISLSSCSSESLNVITEETSKLIGTYPQIALSKLLETGHKNRYSLHELNEVEYTHKILNCFKKDMQFSMVRMFRQYDKYKYQDRFNSNFASDQDQLARLAKLVSESFNHLQK